MSEPFRDLLEEAVNATPEFDTDEEVNGGDLVDWFATWRAKVVQTLGLHPTVTCGLCGGEVPADTAHLHQGQWIGDECCWDDRLKASE